VAPSAPTARLVVAQNYTPGGIKAFNAETWNWWPTCPPSSNRPLSRVVGLADLPGRRFAYSLFDADAIWITDLSSPAPRHRKLPNIGKQPYDAGHAQWPPLHRRSVRRGRPGHGRPVGRQAPVRRILRGYGRGQSRCRS
jgi:protein NirF